MNILYLAHFAGSPEHGMVHAYYHLAREWVKSGHRVTIIASSFAHPRHKQPEEIGIITEQWLDGVRYLWLKTPAYKPGNYAGRVRNVFVFVMRAWFGTLPIEQADLVICSSHHPFAIFPARKLARKFHARLVFEVRDLWPLSLIELGSISSKNPFIWLMQKAENYAYRRADMVVSVLSGSKSYMMEHGMAGEKFCHIPNGYSVSQSKAGLLPLEIEAKLVEIYESKHSLLIGYAGGMNNGNALEPLFQAIANLENKNVSVVLIGTGSNINLLKNYVSKIGISDRVNFLGALEKSAVQGFLKYVDVVYVGFKQRGFYRYGVSPTKLNDYMYAAKPVIYAIDAPDDPVTESGCGISCRAENVEEIAAAIEKFLVMSKAERQAMGQRGYTWLLENRDYQKLAQRFLSEVMPEQTALVTEQLR